MNRPDATHDPQHRDTRARRRPVATFVLIALAIGWPALTVPVVTGLPDVPFLLVLLFVALLGPALLVTRWADGPGAARRLLSRVLVWRFGLGRWAVVLLGMPALTLALAVASGTLGSPDGGWMVEAGWYLLNTLVIGALLANLWEETAWGGFAQTRLMARHGLAVGSLLTALPFAAIHVPMQFGSDKTWSQIWVGLLVLFATAPIYRYLLGMHLLDTRGSILAIGVQHAAWNAAGNLDAVDGEWQVVTAAVLLTVLVAAGRRVWHPESRPWGREAEKAAAATWTDGFSRRTGTTEQS
ncbi:CPBP family intramembrane metalloprotease [Pseudonocardia broussonetiae]|uniref:CPBP family intramembrane metalloprotease n=1 Tax=Pseudonocardia broussonetiae TaxID=2736640 RepID=A0A6M6JUL0_9PSEU|nr:CPBP family intramembrane metalloprotease [Pseudonocardia broussonetiae]